MPTTHLVSPFLVFIVVLGVAVVTLGVDVADLVVLLGPDLLRHLLVQLRLEDRPHLAHKLAEVVLILVGPSKEMVQCFWDIVTPLGWGIMIMSQ